MESLLQRYEKHYGYKATKQELYDLYLSGGISLSDKDENTLLKEMGEL